MSISSSSSSSISVLDVLAKQQHQQQLLGLFEYNTNINNDQKSSLLNQIAHQQHQYKANPNHINMMHHPTTTAATAAAMYSKRFKYDQFDAGSGAGNSMVYSTSAYSSLQQQQQAAASNKVVKNELLSPTGLLIKIFPILIEIN